MQHASGVITVAQEGWFQLAGLAAFAGPNTLRTLKQEGAQRGGTGFLPIRSTAA